MKNLTTGIALALLGLAVTCIGCSQEVTEEDVAAAREKLNEEIAETEEAREEAQEKIRDEEEETAEVRREERETAEARDEAEKVIREEEKETRKAELDLIEKEAKLEAQRERDAFLVESHALMKTADRRLEQLETDAAAQEGATQDATRQRAERTKKARDALGEAIDDCKSVDPLKWQTERPNVEATHRELQAELDAS